MPILYRGVNSEMHKMLRGILEPKLNTEFVKKPGWGTQWGSTWGASSKNAVFHHQDKQAGNPTSGVSTTPRKDRAEFYASGDGYIYEIDTALCEEHKIAIYIVSQHVTHPSIPEDEEVILVSRDYGALPREIIVNVYKSHT